VQQVCSSSRPPDPPDPQTPQTLKRPTLLTRVPPACVKEVNFGMLDCGEGVGLLEGLETLLAQVMVPALRSQQVLGIRSVRSQNVA